jgi:hypothetical protein
LWGNTFKRSASPREQKPKVGRPNELTKEKRKGWTSPRNDLAGWLITSYYPECGGLEAIKTKQGPEKES